MNRKGIMKEHYATKLKIENANLRAALQCAIDALRCIPQTRLDKYAGCPNSEHTMAYRKAVYEIDIRNREAVSRIWKIRDGVEF